VFRFKQFTVQQNSVSMKVNTDGVLLGAWANVENATTILDVGTGTGVIALMMAQRNAIAKIDSIEINKSAVQQAQENFDSSLWRERLSVFNQSFQDYAKQIDKRYDLIVSNPPYFVDALLPPSDVRKQSRHADDLSHEALIFYVKKILQPSGIFSLILPITEGMNFIQLANSYQFFCLRKTIVYSQRHKLPKRLLLEFSLEKSPLLEDELCIYEANSNEYSDAYKSLTSEFYLNF